MTVAAALALAFTLGCIACLVYLHLAPTGYSPVRNAVSEYGVGPYSRWYRLQAALAGIAAICLAIALRHPVRVLIPLVFFAAARIAIGWFPTDSIGARERTDKGRVHLLLAAVAFVAAPVAATGLASSRHGEPWLGRVMAALLIAMVLTMRSGLRPYFGLVERAFYVAMLAWLVLVSVRVL
jgi:hypothetical protein